MGQNDSKNQSSPYNNYKNESNLNNNKFYSNNDVRFQPQQQTFIYPNSSNEIRYSQSNTNFIKVGRAEVANNKNSPLPELHSEKPLSNDALIDSKNKSNRPTKMSMYRELLECPICMNTYDNPHVLPCQHTFCKKCIISLKDNVKDPLMAESIW